MTQHKITRTLAVDFETYYSKTYSVATLGNWGYTHHPEFDAYLLSVVGDDGYEWVGNPKDFDWQLLEGARLIAHNAGFELAVLERLRELGILPDQIRWAELFDTADMAAYLGVPRSLKEAAYYLLNVQIDKGTRDKAKGVHWKDMAPDFQKHMCEYALDDSRNELQLWLQHNHKWPQWEKDLSTETREMCWNGVPTDFEGVKSAIKRLERMLWDARQQIPWAPDPEAPALSPKLAAIECRKHNIEPPKSMAKDSQEFEDWLEKHGKKFPWAKAMGSYRSINALLKKMITLRNRTEPETSIFRYGLKYGGAHTLRDSGDSGFNMQNLARQPMHGVDVRGVTICAPDGYILGVADSGQIEPRILSLLSGDAEKVAMFRKGYDAYEVQARVAHGYDDPIPLKKKDPNYRQYMKVEVLACGYGAGAEKVQIIAKNEVGLIITLQEAETIVTNFRSRPFVPRLWHSLEKTMRASAPGTYELELPSGRIMHYRDVKNFGSLSAVIPRMGKLMRLKWWGGTLTENLVQATARDVFMWQVLQLRAAGIHVLLRAHDEVVALFRKDVAEKDFANMLKIMHIAPPWLSDLPVCAEGILTQRYKKP